MSFKDELRLKANQYHETQRLIEKHRVEAFERENKKFIDMGLKTQDQIDVFHKMSSEISEAAKTGHYRTTIYFKDFVAVNSLSDDYQFNILYDAFIITKNYFKSNGLNVLVPKEAEMRDMWFEFSW